MKTIKLFAYLLFAFLMPFWWFFKENNKGNDKTILVKIDSSSLKFTSKNYIFNENQEPPKIYVYQDSQIIINNYPINETSYKELVNEIKNSRYLIEYIKKKLDTTSKYQKNLTDTTPKKINKSDSIIRYYYYSYQRTSILTLKKQETNSIKVIFVNKSPYRLSLKLNDIPVDIKPKINGKDMINPNSEVFITLENHDKSDNNKINVYIYPNVKKVMSTIQIVFE